MKQENKFTKYSVNEVLISDESDKNYNFPAQKFYFVPVYLRLKIKNFTELDLESLNTKMKCVIFLTVYYGGLQQQIIQLIVKQMNLSFQYNKTIDLNSQSESQQLCLRINEDQKTLNFYIYHQVIMTVTPDVFWTPFQLITSDLTISLNSIVSKTSDNTKVTVKFNLMDHPNPYLKFYYAQDVHFGHYDLAQKKLKVQYLNKNENYYTFFQEYINQKRSKQKQYEVSMKYIDQISKQHKRLKKQLLMANVQVPQSNHQLNLVSLESIQEAAHHKQDGSEQQRNNSQRQKNNSQRQRKYIIKLNNQSIDKQQENKTQNMKMMEEISQHESVQFNPTNIKKMSSQPNSQFQSIRQKKLRIDQLSRFNNFKYAKFHVVLYKKPIASIFALYAPLWLLAFINLSIFFQSSDLGTRIQNIGALVIAFVAFIPVVRSQLPTVPNITFVELVIIGEGLTSVLCLIQSLLVRQQQNFVFVWYKDTLFLISLIITALGIVIVLGMLFIHQIHYQNVYNATVQDTKYDEFKRQTWSSQQLAQNFSKLPATTICNLRPLPIPKQDPFSILFNNLTLHIIEKATRARLMNSGN